eukprot:scaffold40234_cov68-Phaeocystis_antarctica.AAC.9
MHAGRGTQPCASRVRCHLVQPIRSYHQYAALIGLELFPLIVLGLVRHRPEPCDHTRDSTHLTSKDGCNNSMRPCIPVSATALALGGSRATDMCGNWKQSHQGVAVVGCIIAANRNGCCSREGGFPDSSVDDQADVPRAC